ncbi:MAG TPA: tetratricopeptide repeat protein [Roseiflexaceae bacterium]|nr:tetratricopeptide repeat protein [Roseiflexaceae bacterium]
MDVPVSFGYWVRRRRKALDLTQGDLARQVGCAVVTIQKIEADERRPSRQIAELLAEQLAIPQDERTVFLQSARGEVAADRLAAPGTFDTSLSQAADPPNNLPEPLTSFIGRERELAAIAGMFDRTRLLTLTGPGGTGKSRLALHAASDMLGRFPDGVWLIELAPLIEPALVVQSVASVLGVREQPDRSLQASLGQHLREKRLLLVVDNCEHLIAACAHLVEELLRSCPHLRILASSREPLGIGGEAIFRVPPLAAPDADQALPVEQLADMEAIRLFAERARVIQPAFQVSQGNASALAQICRQLDGIPLAIELAAARVRVLTVEQIAARLNDRFRLLSGGSRTALPRHQTLQALVDWSYDLLTESERLLLRRLAVFVGGWTLEAAETVCADADDATHTAGSLQSSEILDLLSRLIDKSLVLVEECNDGLRYRRLETIRQYTLAKLAASDEADALRRRHAAYYLALAEAEAAPIAHDAWTNKIEAEYDNLRAALAWSQSSADSAQLALCLVLAISGYWFGRGDWAEAQTWLQGALTHPEAQRDEFIQLRAEALHELGFLSALQGDYAGGQRYLAESLQLTEQVNDRNAIAWLKFRQGWIAREQGNADMARQRLEESLGLYRELDLYWGVAWVFVTLGEVAVMNENVEWAKELLQEGLALQRKFDIREGIAWALNHLGHVAQLEGDAERATQLHNESIPLFRESASQNLGDLGMAWAFQGLGETALSTGSATAARQHLDEALALFRNLGDRMGMSWCLAGLGGVAALDEEPERAARMWGAAEALRQTIGCRPAPAARATYERLLAEVHDQLGDKAFGAAWTTGQELTLDEALAEAQGE